MTDRFARPAGSLVMALVFVAGSSPAVASVHHHTVHHAVHHTVHHSAGASRHSAKRPHHATRPIAHRDATPSGVTHVLGGGIKLYCAGRSNPLLIRKSTQGAGTTVTVVCR